MTKGNRNGTNIELAKAYVHGRLDEARELGLAKLDKQLNRKLSLWAERFSFAPMELGALVGTVSVGAEGYRLPGAGMYPPSTGQARQAVAALEVVERTYVGDAQGGEHRGSPDSQDAPHQVTAAQPKPRKLQNNPWQNLTEKERLERQIAAFKTRKVLAPTHRKMLASMQARLAQISHPKKPPSKQIAAQSKPKKPGRTNPEKQRLYQLRHEAKKKGLPLPPLPGQAPSEQHAA